MITIIIHGVRGSQAQRIVSKSSKKLLKKDYERRNLSKMHFYRFSFKTRMYVSTIQVEKHRLTRFLVCWIKGGLRRRRKFSLSSDLVN